MKRLHKLIIISVLAAIIICGCNNNLNNKSNTTDSDCELKRVEIVMYLIGTKPTDMDKVLEKINELSESELNATVSVEWIGWGDFANEYPILLSSGEQVDLVYAANWLDFYENAQRGAFLPLEDLLQEYAPKSYAGMSSEAVKDVSVGEHIYAVPSNYKTYNAYGPMIRKDYLKKYEITSINTFDEYIEFCMMIGENNNIDPTGLCSSGIELDDLYLMSNGYYPLTGSTGSLYWIDINDEKKTVYFESECPVMKYFLKNAKKWYESGCWSANVLASKDETMLENRKAVSRVHNYDAWLGESGKNNDLELVYYNLATPIYEQPANQDAMAIPVSAKNPERALMLLEKLKNDERYYMLFTYGIEGYNYEIREDGKIYFLNDTYGNEPGTWGFRDEKYYKKNAAVSDEALAKRDEIATMSKENPMSGFYMDLSDIEKEYSQIDYISKLYFDALVLGYVSYENGIKELNRNLVIEGNDKVKRNLQKQVNKYFGL